jgi:hypothetical protein
MFKFISIALIAMAPTLASSVTHAEDGGAKGGSSEFFYQTEAGKQAVTPKFSFLTSSTQMNGAAKANVSGWSLGASYEYGFISEISVGVTLDYRTEDTKTSGAQTTTASGLDDLQLFVKANMPAGPGSLKYGAALGISPGDHKIETNGDSNNNTGGNMLTPYIGYEYDMAPCVFGAKLATDLRLGDATSKSGSISTDYSGNEKTTFSLFYEHSFSSDMKLGASLDWVTTSDTKPKGGTAVEAISPTQLLSVYLPMTVAAGTLIPELQYGFTTDDKVSGVKIDTYNVMNLDVAYRMTF